ncbi:MAG: DUF2058 family protein [Bdellovibrionota bacterium]
MNLRDQLIKSGLATKEQAKRAERTLTKTQHQKSVDARQKKSDSALAEAEEKARLEMELDEKHAEEKTKARDAQLVVQRTIDIITRGALNDPKAKDSYFFSMPNGQIAKIQVNEWQTMQLAAGHLAIAFLEGETQFVLISVENAQKVMQYHPHAIVCLHRPGKL